MAVHPSRLHGGLGPTCRPREIACLLPPALDRASPIGAADRGDPSYELLPLLAAWRGAGSAD